MKIDKENLFVEKLKKELIKNSEVCAIVLYGSFVSKKANKSSDLDLIIFVNDFVHSKLIGLISRKAYKLFLEYSINLFPSINIWKKSDSKIIVPYYLTCLDLENIRVIYDKINFKNILKSASKELNTNYLKRGLKNDKLFWFDEKGSYTKLLGKYSFRKYLSLKKYADLALKNKDYDATIELNYKSSTFLLSSFLENKGIHLKGKNDSFFLDKEFLRFSKLEEFKQFLENYYVLLNIRKSTIPFNKNINKKIAEKSKLIRIELEKIYKISFK